MGNATGVGKPPPRDRSDTWDLLKSKSVWELPANAQSYYSQLHSRPLKTHNTLIYNILIRFL